MKSFLAIAVAGSIGFGGVCFAQQAEPVSTIQTPTIQVVTKLTVVDVTVTDKGEHPVHGLLKDDFTVKEDGKIQAIRNFDEYGTAIPPAQPALPPLPPGIYTNQPTAVPNTSASNILLFDQINTGMNLYAHPELFLYAKQQAISYLKTLPPGTRVAIMVAENELRLAQDFTTDKDVLIAAVNKLVYKPADNTVATMLSGLRISSNMIGIANQRSRLTINALRQVSAYTVGIKGRKNIVWFTAGIPWLTDYPRFFKITSLDNYTPQLKATFDMLRASRGAIYTIDSHGLRSTVTAETDNGEETNVWPMIGSLYEQRTLDRESMQDFADATGGRAYYNRNDLDAMIANAIATGSDYYAVSYIPPRSKYDDQYHAIDVKVDRPNLRLQYKNGYTAQDLAKLNNAILENAAAKGKTSAADALPAETSLFRTAGMGHGAATSTELLLAARIVPATAGAAPLPVKGELNPAVKAKALVRYDIVYSIPAGQITVADNADGTHAASVELDVVAYGEDGTKLNVVRQTAKVALQAEQVAGFEKNPFEPHVQMDLPPGKVFVRVGVLDVASGKSGTLEVPQTVAKP